MGLNSAFFQCCDGQERAESPHSRRRDVKTRQLMPHLFGQGQNGVNQFCKIPQGFCVKAVAGSHTDRHQPKPRLSVSLRM